jgi:hypothetical protein
MEPLIGITGFWKYCFHSIFVNKLKNTHNCTYNHSKSSGSLNTVLLIVAFILWNERILLLSGHSWAFTKTEFSETFSGLQSCQVCPGNKLFRDGLRHCRHSSDMTQLIAFPVTYPPKTIAAAIYVHDVAVLIWVKRIFCGATAQLGPKPPHFWGF